MYMQNTQNHNIVGLIFILIAWSIALVIFGYLLHSFAFITEKPTVYSNQQESSIFLQRERDNHFRMPIKINDKEAMFMIDTGATMITVSERFANIAQLPPGPEIKVNTASGSITAHLSKIKKLNIGPWQFNNISALVMPNMDADPLLGMNILKHFTMEQQEKYMILKNPQRALDPSL